MSVPTDRRYTHHHLWATPVDGGAIRVGLASGALSLLGDVVHLELPPDGSSFDAGEPFGLVESSSTVMELVAPFAGRVVCVNEAAVDAPEAVTDDPYGAGWLLDAVPDVPSACDALLPAESYAMIPGAG